MNKPFPDNSKKIWHLYASLMVLEIIYLTLFMRVGLKWTHILILNVVSWTSLFLTTLKRYNTCMQLSWYWKQYILTLFMRVVIKWPQILTLNVVRCIGLVLTILLYSAHDLVALGLEHVWSQDPFIREHLLIKKFDSYRIALNREPWKRTLTGHLGLIFLSIITYRFFWISKTE